MEEAQQPERIPVSKLSTTTVNAKDIEESTDMILRLLYKDRIALDDKTSKCWNSDDESSDTEHSKDSNSSVKNVVEQPLQNKKDVADGPISVTFNIRAQTKFGEELFVVGSLPQIGSWNPDHAIKLQTNKESYPNWSVTTTLLSRVVEYKYIILKDPALRTFKWEEFNTNRSLDLSGCGLWCFIDDGQFDKKAQSQVVNAMSLQDLNQELEAYRNQILTSKEEKEDLNCEVEKQKQKNSELQAEINLLKKQVAVLEGVKLETLSTSDLKSLVTKSKKTAHRANVELTKRLENEIYHLQRLRDCAVCMDKPIDTVCIPCGHMALCLECANKLHSRCVICNVKIQKIQKVFMK